MTRANLTKTNIVGGEISPLMYGRPDLPVTQKAVAICENVIALPQGGGSKRLGSQYVNYTRLNKTAALIPFQFSDQQSYIVEATEFVFRIFTNNGALTEGTKNITAMTNANPGVFTSAAHGYTNGQSIFLRNINGTSGLTGKFYYVTGVTLNAFTLTDAFGTVINTTSSGTYTGGGTAERVLEIATPFAEADLPFLKYAQTADTMYITNQNYEPRKFTRTGALAWSVATYTRSANPFPSNNNQRWPAAVCFTSDSRLLMGGTKEKPEALWASRAPDANNGDPQYDVYTTGTDPTNLNNPYVFTLAALNGKADSIRWLSNTNKFIVIGCFGSVRRLFGSTEEVPPTPLSVSSKPVTSFGVDYANPVTDGSTFFYSQRGAKAIRSLEFDYTVDGYETNNMNLISEHLTKVGIKQVTAQSGSPDCFWLTLNDGKIAGLTYKDKEEIAGWHRHYLGGSHVDSSGVVRNFAKVLWQEAIGRSSGADQLWYVVERFINGRVVRSIEYANDEQTFPIREDFFSSVSAEATDDVKYRNAAYEIQKGSIYLDMAVSYDGASFGAAASATMTPGATTGTGITFTASAAVFNSGMVGQEIWKKYDVNGNGGGRARITAFTDSTHVVCTVLSAFDFTTAIPAGNWFLTTGTISNLDHLVGQTVQVVADGGPLGDFVVPANGSITLGAQASKVHVGFNVRSTIKSLNLDFGGVTGSAQAKRRNVRKVVLRFLNTVGADYGTSMYRTEHIPFKSTADISGRAVPVFSGSKEVLMTDSWDIEKSFVVKQEQPLPMTLLSYDLMGDTTDE